MIITSTNEWELINKSGLVSVGSYSLFVSTGGPPRKSDAPAVIFITGGGVPTEFYVHLHYAISKFARNYFYDRAGYGRSERPDYDGRSEEDEQKCTNGSQIDVEDHAENSWRAPGRSVFSNSSGKHHRKITAEDSASELHRLMQAIDVQPPYVIAAHSYSGIIARTYYGLYPDDIVGMALLDTNSELLQECLGPIPPPAYQKVTTDVDQERIMHLREASRMTDEEWDAAVAAVVRTQPASADEATHRSGRELARRMQIDHQAMGDKPLIVLGSRMVEEWRLFLDEGLKLGGGTEAEQHEAKWWMETAELFCNQVQRTQLGLSGNAEYIRFEDFGHYFPITAPERTAEVIKKLLNKCRGREDW